MKLKTLFKTLFLLIITIIITLTSSITLHAQGSRPQPLDMSFLNLIEGSWTGQSDMMGTKMNEQLVCTMNFNKQYLVINLTAASEDNAHTYSGMGVYGSDADGNVKSWWFDEWGVGNVSMGSGKIDAMKMTLESASTNSTMNRTIELTGGNLVMKWTSTFKDNEGQMQTLSGETTYTKTK
jgi:hypothetical protein